VPLFEGNARTYLQTLLDKGPDHADLNHDFARSAPGGSASRDTRFDGQGHQAFRGTAVYWASLPRRALRRYPASVGQGPQPLTDQAAEWDRRPARR
jgi:hypothetical protein